MGNSGKTEEKEWATRHIDCKDHYVYYSRMKNKKIRIAVLFGGKSAEHEVSLQSAKNVVASLDKKKYEVVLIGIDKKGVWHLCPEEYLFTASFSIKKSLPSTDQVNLLPTSGKSLLLATTDKNIGTLDLIFPMLHGPYGEDGSMQGLLQLANIPCVGSGILGSAIGMDKDVTKRLLKEAGLPVGDFFVVRQGENITFAAMKKQFGLPFFIKPANLGSSIGVSKVNTKKEFEEAVVKAFLYDTKILIEQYIAGKEVECSVLGNQNPIASIAGEIVANRNFYDYEAKYLDENGAVLKIPAAISSKKMKEVQQLAVKAFQVLCLDGMARIDFFFTPDKRLYINEANTIPGFTNISMYPKLWEESGMSYTELVDKLIQLAIERFKEKQELRTEIV